LRKRFLGDVLRIRLRAEQVQGKGAARPDRILTGPRVLSKALPGTFSGALAGSAPFRRSGSSGLHATAGACFWKRAVGRARSGWVRFVPERSVLRPGWDTERASVPIRAYHLLQEDTSFCRIGRSPPVRGRRSMGVWSAGYYKPVDNPAPPEAGLARTGGLAKMATSVPKPVSDATAKTGLWLGVAEKRASSGNIFQVRIPSEMTSYSPLAVLRPLQWAFPGWAASPLVAQSGPPPWHWEETGRRRILFAAIHQSQGVGCLLALRESSRSMDPHLPLVRNLIKRPVCDGEGGAAGVMRWCFLRTTLGQIAEGAQQPGERVSYSAAHAA